MNTSVTATFKDGTEQTFNTIEEAAEIDAVATSRNLIVVVPGIIKRVGK